MALFLCRFSLSMIPCNTCLIIAGHHGLVNRCSANPLTLSAIAGTVLSTSGPRSLPATWLCTMPNTGLSCKTAAVQLMALTVSAQQALHLLPVAQGLCSPLGCALCLGTSLPLQLLQPVACAGCSAHQAAGAGAGFEHSPDSGACMAYRVQVRRASLHEAPLPLQLPAFQQQAAWNPSPVDAGISQHLS